MSYTGIGSKHELAKPILGEDINGVMDFLVRDSTTNCMGTISTAHLKGHQGKSFYAYHRNLSLANAGTVDLLLVTAASNYPHTIFYVTTGGNSTIEFYTGTTTSANGTAITAHNRNRNSATTPLMTLYHTPTVTAAGTEIYADYVIAGDKNKSTGGSDGFSEEVILAPSTKHLIRITNVSGSAEVVNVQIHWYE